MASTFVSTLPDPDSIDSTIEEIELKKAQEEKFSSKVKNVFFKKEQKEQEKKKQETQDLLLKMQESDSSNGDM